MSTSLDPRTTLYIPDKVLLRPDEVADIFQVTVQTVYKWRNNGTLPCVKRLGHPVRFKRDSIIALINEEE